MKTNIYTWTTLVLLLMTLFGVFKVVTGLLFVPPWVTLMWVVLTLMWAYFFKKHLELFNEVERLNDR